jgi:molybdopterin biosynthesis enzyme MoaB
MPDNLVVRIGVLTISDRASRGEYEDKSGRAITDFLDRANRGLPEGGLSGHSLLSRPDRRSFH